MSRRTDFALRETINHIEGFYIKRLTPHASLTISINELGRLLKSDYAATYFVRSSNNLGYKLNFINIEPHDKCKKNPEYYDWFQSIQLSKDCLEPLRRGQLLSFTRESSGFISQLPSPEGIENTLIIPLLDAGEFYGVGILVNATQTTSLDQIKSRLSPLLIAINCLHRVSSAKVAIQSTGERQLEYDEPISTASLDAMFNPILMVNLESKIVTCNVAASHLVGLKRFEVSGQDIRKFLPGINRPKLDEQKIWGPRRGNSFYKANGTKVLVDLTIFSTENSEMYGYILNDISEQMKVAEQYHYSLEQFKVLTNTAPIGIIQLNSQFECIYVNDCWCKYVELTPEESYGMRWLNGLYKDDADTILQTLCQSILKNGKFEKDFRLRTPLGKLLWVEANASAFYDSKGEVSGIMVTFNDVTEHVEKERKLRHIAERDQLTGLVNRAFFMDQVREALLSTQRYGSVVVAFVDLDAFKDINDTMGHDVGDALLQEVSDRLRNCVREVDIIARLGGDEFTLLLKDVRNIRAVQGIADKIVTKLGEPFELNERSIYITCSIGIAISNNQEITPQGILKNADIALYKAKSSGKNQYKFYTPSDDKDANFHLLIKQSLREDGRKDFKLVYQPIMDAKTNSVVSVECLTRWEHTQKEKVTPFTVIRMIEESGLIADFFTWQLEEVFSSFNDWRENNVLPNNFKLSINLSAKQLRNKELVAFIVSKTQQYRIHPRLLSFEVTETALLEDPITAKNTLQRMKKIGFGLSLDDFGTGYSSLSYLRELPVDAVKIDRSFICDVLENDQDATIVASIIDLSIKLSLKVIAEGVESEEIRNWLIEHGCDHHQGFLYSQALEPQEVQLRLQKQKENGKVLQLRA